jgi:hypothetical protein
MQTSALTPHRLLTHDEIEDLYRARITRIFDEVSPRPDWLIQFAHGEVGAVLVHQAEHAELLVVGTREHVGLGRLVAGSVSHYCLSHALCPVVTVPAPSPLARRPLRRGPRRSPPRSPPLFQTDASSRPSCLWLRGESCGSRSRRGQFVRADSRSVCRRADLPARPQSELGLIGGILILDGCGVPEQSAHDLPCCSWSIARKPAALSFAHLTSWSRCSSRQIHGCVLWVEGAWDANAIAARTVPSSNAESITDRSHP